MNDSAVFSRKVKMGRIQRQIQALQERLCEQRRFFLFNARCSGFTKYIEYLFPPGAGGTLACPPAPTPAIPTRYPDLNS